MKEPLFLEWHTGRKWAGTHSRRDWELTDPVQMTPQKGAVEQVRQAALGRWPLRGHERHSSSQMFLRGTIIWGQTPLPFWPYICNKHSRATMAAAFLCFLFNSAYKCYLWLNQGKLHFQNNDFRQINRIHLHFTRFWLQSLFMPWGKRW